MQQEAYKWDSTLYDDKHSFVYRYGADLVDMLGPKKGEKVLDLGCGSGALTEALRTRSGSVVGVDSSSEMIKKARNTYPLCTFLKGDARNFSGSHPFDCIFSNATLHWVIEPEKAVKCMFENLRYGGRVALEFGGKNNVDTVIQALRRILFSKGYKEQSALQLWYFPSISTYTSLLERNGFEVTLAEWYDRPTELADGETGILDWLSMFAKPFFKGIAAEEASVIKKEVQGSVSGALFKNSKWYADYKRIRVLARKIENNNLK
ncbi:class I SAM-dependent methyltransferase [Maribacter sp. 2-571]|uniref:class I SAM-dependent methyltransferase n=1 Tax=Maribacter sp. 2-571 TaxID=3417569 RepID=UPI003D327DB4